MLRILLLCIAVAFLPAWSNKGDLTRDGARVLLEPQLRYLQRLIASDGNARQSDLPKQYGIDFQSLPMRGEILKYAEERFDYRSGRAWFKVLPPTMTYSIEVTGIARKDNFARVEFNYSQGNVPALVKLFSTEGGKGSAEFRLYDDGWRPGPLDLVPSNRRFTFSARENAELQAMRDVQAKVDEQRRHEASRPKETHYTAQWGGRNPDGTLPVGTWSYVHGRKPECEIKFPSLAGSRVQYEFNDMHNNWRDYVPGTPLASSSWRVAMTEGGKREFVYTEVCAPPGQRAIQANRPRTENAARKRVLISKITVPAHGSQTISKSLRCYVDDRTDVNAVGRADIGRDLVFTSQLNAPKPVTIWFFDEGGDCTSDFNKLMAERAFK